MDKLNWISVDEAMPETDGIHVKAKQFDMDPESTVNVLCYTDMGSVVDNWRVKNIDGEWQWVMSIQDEEITHWSLFNLPTLNNK